VRWRADGNIEFLGRIDHQVKLRGFRIELGEIEASLRRHTAVREGVVVLRTDMAGEARLVAYVVQGAGSEDKQTSRQGDKESPVQGSGIRDEGSGDASIECLTPDPRSPIPDLRTFLKQTLPDYMVPTAFVLLNALPKTPSGKIDRKALPAPDGARPYLNTAYVAPRTEAERLVAEIWAALLRQDRVGVHDNFFDLGGHSLLATQAIARLSKAIGVKLPLRTLFEAPTVAELARRVTTVQEIARQLAAPRGVLMEDEEEIEL